MSLELLKKLRANASRRADLMRERDALILQAKAEGAAVTHIAEAVGLTRTQVHRIIRENGSKA